MNKHYYSKRVYYFVLLLALILQAVQVVPSAAQSSTAAAPISIKNFGKVNDKYYRGSQPDANQFEGLKRLGIKTVIDLRKDRVEEASKWAGAAGLEYINIPLTTKRAATEQQTAEFLKLVNDPAKLPVYVHCKGGRHRAGQMTAIYRITNDGWTAEQAYQEMKKYDFEDSWFYPRPLKKYVFSYYEWFKSEKNSQSGTSNTAP